MTNSASIGCRAARDLTCLVVVIVVGTIAAADDSLNYSVLSDPRLQIALYASDPDIVTPIDAAVDAHGRLYVVESHTHSPPADYDGPSGDRIKVFEGMRSDGYAKKVSVFADDLFQAQSIAFDAQGTLYVVCTRAVFALHDRDGDGRAPIPRHSSSLAFAIRTLGWSRWL